MSGDGMMVEEPLEVGGGVSGSGDSGASGAPGAPGPTRGSRIAQLLQRVQALEEEAARARDWARESDLRRRIETALQEAGAVDVETASLLVERAIAGVDEPDVEGAVSALRTGKGWLFASPSAVGALHAPAGEGSDDAALAARAAARGDRRALLRYLRLRRNG